MSPLTWNGDNQKNKEAIKNLAATMRWGAHGCKGRTEGRWEAHTRAGKKRPSPPVLMVSTKELDMKSDQPWETSFWGYVPVSDKHGFRDPEYTAASMILQQATQMAPNNLTIWGYFLNACFIILAQYSSLKKQGVKRGVKSADPMARNMRLASPTMNKQIETEENTFRK